MAEIGNKKIRVANIETDLTQLLYERLNITALERLASVVVERTPGDGTEFSILPFDDKQAKVVVHYEDGVSWITVDVAENTVLEVPFDGNQYTDINGIQELISILEGITANGVEETVWKKDGMIVKSIGTLFLNEEESPIRIKCYSLHNPFAKRQRTSKRYFPYF